MSKRIVSTLVAAAAFLSTASIASAQDATPGRLIELGIDAGVSFGLDKPHYTSVDIPAQHIRAGFFISPKISLEPSLGISSVSTGGNHSTSYTAELGALWHFRTPRSGYGMYLRPFAGFTGFSASGADSDTRALLGGGVGIKFPFANRLATRFEANYQHVFAANGGDSGNTIGLLAGLSFFTR